MIIETKGQTCAVGGISTSEVTATIVVMTESVTSSSKKSRGARKMKKGQTTR